MDLEERFRVPQKGFRLADCDPADTAGLDKDDARRRREHDLDRLDELQERLFAERTRALLVVLQGLDASGKDGTIADVMRDPTRGGMTPAACHGRRRALITPVASRPVSFCCRRHTPAVSGDGRPWPSRSVRRGGRISPLQIRMAGSDLLRFGQPAATLPGSGAAVRAAR